MYFGCCTSETLSWYASGRGLVGSRSLSGVWLDDSSTTLVISGTHIERVAEDAGEDFYAAAVDTVDMAFDACRGLYAEGCAGLRPQFGGATPLVFAEDSTSSNGPRPEQRTTRRPAGDRSPLKTPYKTTMTAAREQSERPTCSSDASVCAENNMGQQLRITEQLDGVTIRFPGNGMPGSAPGADLPADVLDSLLLPIHYRC